MIGAAARRAAAAACLAGLTVAWTGPGDAVAQAIAVPVVVAGHPRLIVGGVRGTSVEALRAACAHPELAEACARIGGRHVLDDAMRVLLDDDAPALGRARAALLDDGAACGDGVEHAPAGGHALAYDWLHDRLAPDERRAIAAGLAACGTRIAAALRGNAPHLWHGFTSQAAALALVALAVDEGELPAADVGRLRADAAELFRDRALEAYAVVGGAWPEGTNYLRSHFFSSDPPDQYVLDAVRAWDTAVVEDSTRHAGLVDAIRGEQGDWLRGLALHLVYGSYPPSGPGGRITLRRAGDVPTGQAWPNKQIRPMTDAIARLTGDGAIRTWGQRLETDWPLDGGDGTYHAIHRYALPLSAPLDVAPAPLDDLPLSRVWGRADLGDVIARSGWDDDAVVVGYRAGAWFTGHQHLDQGHLDVWHRGPLALDAGVYAPWGSEHREAYYLRSVAHNTLLVPMPDETFQQHPALREPIDDAGQRIPTYAGCPQCLQSVAEWRANLGAGLHLEGGVLEAYEDVAGSVVLASDLTGAYNSVRYAAPGNVPKVEIVQRDLAYLRPDAIVVVDRVVTVPRAGSPRFVLHLPARPEIGPHRVTRGTETDGILVGEGRLATVANDGGGHLAVRTLWPGATRLTAIGGPGHRYWVDGANRAAGSEGLEGPPAEPGTWRIEVESAGAPEAGAHLMVHALVVGGVDAAARAAEARVLDVAGDPAAGPPGIAVAVPAPSGGAERLLLRSRGVPRAALRFARLARAAAVPATLVAADLAPGERHRIVLDGRVAFDGAASLEGVVAIEAGKAGIIALGACPEPDDAGAAWTALCAAAPAPPTAAPTATATSPSEPPPAAGALHLPRLSRP